MSPPDDVPPTPRPAPASEGLVALGAGTGLRWWAVAVLGAVVAGLGVWMLLNLTESVLVLAIVVGLSLMSGGFLVLAIDDGSGRWQPWVEALLLVAAGGVVLTWPDITLRVLALVAGLGLVLSGGVHVIAAVTNRHTPGWVRELALGTVGVVVGGVVLAWPGPTLLVLTVLFGIRAVVTGVGAVGLAWQLRPAHSRAA